MGSKVSKVNSDSTASKDTYQAEVAPQGEAASTTSSDNGGLHQGINFMAPARLSELLYGLQVIAKLQRGTTEAQIESREKRREAMQNREDVWFWDDKLIREIQKLVDEGKLHAFEDLTQVVNKCHAARNRVGPLEQEVIETERKLESQFWKLQQAEENLNNEFQHEFHQEGHYPEPIASRASSSYRNSYDSGNDEVQDAFMLHEENIPLAAATSSALSSSSFPRNSPQIETSAQNDEMISKEEILSDLIHDDTRQTIERENMDLQSELQGIDEILNDRLPAVSLEPRRPLPVSSHTGLEQYPGLLTDFQTGRERINKWIQNTALESRFEATSLFTGLQMQLSAENQPVPSNWAQLVMAFWALDEAAVPKAPT